MIPDLLQTAPPKEALAKWNYVTLEECVLWFPTELGLVPDFWQQLLACNLGDNTEFYEIFLQMGRGARDGGGGEEG